MGNGERRVAETAGKSLMGAATGAVMGGEIGAILGASAPLVEAVYSDVINRLLSDAERERLAITRSAAAEVIQRRLGAGDELRTEVRGSGSRAARRTCESVLVAAQRDPDDRKARHLGILLANLGFKGPWSGDETAAELLRLMRELTYTQLRLIALVAEPRPLPLPGRSTGPPRGGWDDRSVAIQLAEIGYGGRELVVPDHDPSRGLPTDTSTPSVLKLGGWGRALHVMSGLDTIMMFDLQPIAHSLWAVSGLEPPTEISVPGQSPP